MSYRIILILQNIEYTPDIEDKKDTRRLSLAKDCVCEINKLELLLTSATGVYDATNLLTMQYAININSELNR
jgi:hypothetical protein